ncbi:MAG: FGGY family carbohydrate kinase, partial [Pacificimonas sp.]
MTGDPWTGGLGRRDITNMNTPLYLGIDIGTSGVKAIVIDDGNAIAGETDAPLGISRPAPLHSEQDPADWWVAVERAVTGLDADLRARIAAIGVTGQMHGAVLLDGAGAVLRPAILWNDGRSHAECAELEAALPELSAITGNRAMPGFTAPKLLWVRAHEPDMFARIAKVLLPKDWLRYRMSGAMVSDMSDAAGTLWLDVGKRDWSDEALAACGLTRDHMPDLAEGSVVSAHLSADIAARWGLRAGIPIA